MEEATTIKLSKKTKERLSNFKVYPHETFEEAIIKMFDIINMCKINPQEANRKLLQIDQQRKQT